MKNIANRKVSKSNYVIYILLFVALLAVNGLLNFIVASFDPTIFTSATYWVKTFTGAASGLGAFIIFAYMRRDTLIAHNTSYNDNLSELNKIVKSNVDQTISPFVGFKNFEAKRQAWTDSTSHKLQRHHDRASQRILNGLYELETFGEVASKWTRRKVEKWIKKKEKLELHLSEDWIMSNLRYRKLVYPQISVAELINGTRKVSNEKNIINTNAFGTLLRDRLPVILLNTMLQVVYNALIITQAANPVELILGLLFQLLTIFMNVAIGMNYGATLFNKVDVNNLDIRRFYIMEYLVWKKSAPKQGGERERVVSGLRGAKLPNVQDNSKEDLF